MSNNVPSANSPTENVAPTEGLRIDEREDKVVLADVLDDLLGVLAQATRGGESRTSTAERSKTWEQRFTLLVAEARLAMKVEDAQNKRNAARRKQMKKKRTMERKL